MSFDDLFRAEYPGLVRTVAPIVGPAADAEAGRRDLMMGFVSSAVLLVLAAIAIRQTSTA